MTEKTSGLGEGLFLFVELYLGAMIALAAAAVVGYFAVSIFGKRKNPRHRQFN